MKKTFFVLSILIAVCLISLFLQNLNKTVQTSSESKSEFAQIKYNNVYIYKTADANEKWFLLEETYFVKIINSINESFFEVEYKDLSGYVKKSEVQFVKETPSFPYLENITFSIGSKSIDAKSNPNEESKIVFTLEANCENVEYYGKMVGQQLDENLGNIWYFCKHNNKFGYVYAPSTKNLSAITANVENFTTVSTTISNPLNNLLYLNLSTQNILIVAVSLPLVIFMILLFKSKKEI